MKKLLALSLILVMILCSCAGVNKDDRKKSDAGEENDNKNQAGVVYTLYAATHDGADKIENLFKESTDMKIENISDKNFVVSDFSNEVTAPSSVLQSKKVTVDGKERSLSFFSATVSEFASSKAYAKKNLGTAYTYKFTEGMGHIAFNGASDNILWFFDADASRSEKAGTLTETELSEKADTLFADLYGKETAELYTAIDCGKSDEKTFIKTFSRKVYGYETNDTVKFVLNASGELCVIYAENFGLFDGATSDIKKEEIEAAEKLLRESVGDDWSLATTSSVQRDSAGQFFVMIKGTNDKLSGENYEQSFYINVN